MVAVWPNTKRDMNRNTGLWTSPRSVIVTRLPSPLAAILDGLRWAYPFRLDGTVAEDGATVVIEVSGPVRATWWLVAADGRWGFGAEPGPGIVAGATLTGEQAWRLLSNNLPPAEQQRLDVWGDARLVDVIRRTRAIIGAPK